MRKDYKPGNSKRKRASVSSMCLSVHGAHYLVRPPLLMLCYLLSCTYYTTYLYLLLPLVIFEGEHFRGTFIGGKDE